MILIGQYDSPFVRRVAIALRLYGMDYEHRPWSVFANADEIAQYNPLRRVPTLVLEDGEVLIESGAILDHLDEVAGEARALVPRSGAVRRHALKIIALSTGMTDKAVSLVYERLLHPEPSEVWLERCRTQIGAVLDRLEDKRAIRPGPYLFGPDLGHADIALACALRFVSEAHPDVYGENRWPSLVTHAERCEALDVFREVAQPFSVSPPKRA